MLWVDYPNDMTMRPVRPKQEVDALKQDILSKALKLITQEGFDSLTMRRLGRELGMTAPNLYNYYRSKEEIYLTLMLQGFTLLKNDLICVVNESPDLVSQARDLMKGYLRFALENPEYYQLMFSSQGPKAQAYEGTEVEGLSRQEFAAGMEVADYAETFLKGLLDYVGLDTDHRQRLNMLIEVWSLLHGMASLHLTGNTHYLTDAPLETYDHIIAQLLERFINPGKTIRK